jgi:hypothetical protein
LYFVANRDRVLGCDIDVVFRMTYVLMVVIDRKFRSSAPLGKDNADEEETTVPPVAAPPRYSQDGSGHRIFTSVLTIAPKDDTFQQTLAHRRPGYVCASGDQRNGISRDSKLSTNKIPSAIPSFGPPPSPSSTTSSIPREKPSWRSSVSSYPTLMVPPDYERFNTMQMSSNHISPPYQHVRTPLSPSAHPVCVHFVNRRILLYPTFPEQ